MTLDLAEALRRDDLWLDADAPMQVLCTVSRGGWRDLDVVLVELEDGRLLQALVVESSDGERFGFAPLAFGPVREGAR